MAESHCCSLETTTTLLISYIAIQNKIFKGWRKKTNKHQEGKDDPSWILVLIRVLVFLLILSFYSFFFQSPCSSGQCPTGALCHWPCVKMEFEMGSLYNNNVSTWNLELGLFTLIPGAAPLSRVASFWPHLLLLTFFPGSLIYDLFPGLHGTTW